MSTDVELLEMGQMRPSENGMSKVYIREVIFTAFKAEDIEVAIKTRYATRPFPVGVIPPEPNKQGFWSWGFFKRGLDHETYKQNVQDMVNSKIFMSEKYQQTGTFKYFEGALVDARQVFSIQHNNRDTRLFVKFTDITIEPL